MKRSRSEVRCGNGDSCVGQGHSDGRGDPPRAETLKKFAVGLGVAPELRAGLFEAAGLLDSEAPPQFSRPELEAVAVWAAEEALRRVGTPRGANVPRETGPPYDTTSPYERLGRGLESLARRFLRPVTVEFQHTAAGLTNDQVDELLAAIEAQMMRGDPGP